MTTCYSFVWITIANGIMLLSVVSWVTMKPEVVFHG